MRARISASDRTEGFGRDVGYNHVQTGFGPAGLPDRGPRSLLMTITMAHLAPIVALIAGVLILLMPRLLNFIVAIYLIITGLLGLFPHLLR